MQETSLLNRVPEQQQREVRNIPVLHLLTLRCPRTRDQCRQGTEEQTNKMHDRLIARVDENETKQHIMNAAALRTLRLTNTCPP